MNYVARMNRMTPEEKATESTKPLNSRTYYNNAEGRKALKQVFGRVNKNVIQDIDQLPPKRRGSMMRAFSAVFPGEDPMELLKKEMKENNNKLAIQKGFNFVNKKVGALNYLKQRRVKQLLSRMGSKRDTLQELRKIVNANITNSNNNVIRKAIPRANTNSRVKNLLTRTGVNLSKFKNKKNFMKELRGMIGANYSMNNNKVIEMAIKNGNENVKKFLNNSNINVNKYRVAMNKRDKFKELFGEDTNAFERFKYSRGGIENALKSISNQRLRNKIGKAVSARIAQEAGVSPPLVRTTPTGEIQVAQSAFDQVTPVVTSYQPPPPITIQVKSGNVRVNAPGGTQTIGSSAPMDEPQPTKRNTSVGTSNRGTSNRGESRYSRNTSTGTGTNNESAPMIEHRPTTMSTSVGTNINIKKVENDAEIKARIMEKLERISKQVG